uniref:Uncharacterized protein n=1 Tax=Populus alba TaxID=43335 RepID=A0A4U5PRS9_POPAL|nr:hypothetical protein D5086_0000204790 [Populus alba]
MEVGTGPVIFVNLWNSSVLRYGKSPISAGISPERLPEKSLGKLRGWWWGHTPPGSNLCSSQCLAAMRLGGIEVPCEPLLRAQLDVIFRLVCSGNRSSKECSSHQAAKGISFAWILPIRPLMFEDTEKEFWYLIPSLMFRK